MKLDELEALEKDAIEPKCSLSGCGALVGRPKCLLELNVVECPRHAQAAVWRGSEAKYTRALRNAAPELIAATRTLENLKPLLKDLDDSIGASLGSFPGRSVDWQDLLQRVRNFRKLLEAKP